MFCEERIGKNRILYVHLPYKDVDRFSEWVGPRIKSCFKAWQASKIHARSREIRQMSHARVQTCVDQHLKC